jgi:hypothetical protein
MLIEKYDHCEDCGWSDETDPITEPDHAQARATAWLSLPKERSDGSRPAAKLCYTCLRSPSDLPPPEDTLILDATPTPAVYAHLFDVDESSIHREGTTRSKLNADVTQIVNGRYHEGTVRSDSSSGDNLRRDVRTIIESVCTRHQEDGTPKEDDPDVILVGHQGARNSFPTPANAEWIDFYVGRGLDRPDAKAIIVVGAPHPNPTMLNRTAGALAVGTGADRGYVVYDGDNDDRTQDLESRRPYWYVNENGEGYSAGIKPRCGIEGAMFEDSVEQELVQMLHRIRPVTATTTKEIYLLTNIPLPVPVKNLTSRRELVEWAKSEQIELISKKADELLILVAELLEAAPEQNNLSQRSKIENDHVRTTVDDLYTLYCRSCGDVSKQSIRNGLDELLSYGVVSRERHGKTFDYSFPQTTVNHLANVITDSGDLGLTARLQLQNCPVRTQDDEEPEWISNTREIISRYGAQQNPSGN